MHCKLCCVYIDVLLYFIALGLHMLELGILFHGMEAEGIPGEKMVAMDCRCIVRVRQGEECSPGVRSLLGCWNESPCPVGVYQPCWNVASHGSHTGVVITGPVGTKPQPCLCFSKPYLAIKPLQGESLEKRLLIITVGP